ncbi:uncharacterized protein KY384_008509 [Bacidia gigantensis]|uniref:uncharacterized protein n=1 Tax=Bacidia gigantensis TaxID=2732470 RepID=UPI001D051B84|nr:uncharacterized protein KY384_008509 [Bacidia gigantensis]KAG8527080.1 hypothetical protein KY384_008509 [Bacidia gigantensis]
MSTKRKAVLAAANNASESSQTPPAKKRKFSNELPEYYDEIGLPIALDTIERRLERHEYATISTLESDVKRMISNAKSFNTKASQIYSDAEKVRKLVSNFMVDRNPAYRDQTYQAVATPLPPGWESRSGIASTPREAHSNGNLKLESQATESKSGRRSGRTAAATPIAEEEIRRASSTPAVQDVEGTGESFEGNSFQQAQEKIVTEMMGLTDEDNRLVSANFIHLPPRSLIDYYQIIRHPVSIKALQKQVRGAKGHNGPTGTTLLRSWNSFAEEASFIWNNAREYNEDGSEIVELAEQLQEYFVARVKEAKAVVTEPPQPRVKLTIGGKSPEPPPKITLKFGSKSSNASGISVDNEALKRQQELVKAASSTHATPTVQSVRPLPDRAVPGLEKAAINGIKREVSQGRSPGIAPSLVNGVNHTAMPPLYRIHPESRVAVPIPRHWPPMV